MSVAFWPSCYRNRNMRPSCYHPYFGKSCYLVRMLTAVTAAVRMPDPILLSYFIVNPAIVIPYAPSRLLSCPCFWQILLSCSYTTVLLSCRDYFVKSCYLMSVYTQYHPAIISMYFGRLLSYAPQPSCCRNPDAPTVTAIVIHML
ncbi:hypothetical protein AVEN_106253-1 [Araneus ventricosus]|uniref:Uncharacterized protein n=1 Tax=Araneus ventricosus TaxID=182803 RepID=A0A4Y2W9T8_ARAVE|nr:hypothetical protein AVEN_106253-1 [Araneus ventricosus]